MKFTDNEQFNHKLFKEIRPWGGFQILINNSMYKVKHIWIKPKQRLSFQAHLLRDEHWIIVKGSVLVWIRDKIKKLLENQSCFISKKTPHRIENETDKIVEIIEVQYGKYLGEDDIIRYQDDYNRI